LQGAPDPGSGFGDLDNTYVRVGAVFGGRPHFACQNRISGVEMWAALPPGWEQTNTDGFGSVANETAFTLKVFGNALYAVTDNTVSGCEVWRLAPVPFFSDGFEDGDVSAWASSVG
jgi:hypothetical protein